MKVVVLLAALAVGISRRKALETAQDPALIDSAADPHGLWHWVKRLSPEQGFTVLQSLEEAAEVLRIAWSLALEKEVLALHSAAFKGSVALHGLAFILRR